LNGKLALLIGLAIAFAGAAQGRDFEMGGDSPYPYSITPDPGARHPLHMTKRLSRLTFHHHLRCAQGRNNILGSASNQYVTACLR
jgi:hypothetical protein